MGVRGTDGTEAVRCALKAHDDVDLCHLGFFPSHVILFDKGTELPACGKLQIDRSRNIETLPILEHKPALTFGNQSLHEDSRYRRRCDHFGNTLWKHGHVVIDEVNGIFTILSN